jgi:hypothetical protein
MRVLIPAFVTSELKTAFQIGFIVFIPFLIIDMVVASVLMSMGMMMMSPVIVALPFKIMLFVLVDGWNLLIGSLYSVSAHDPDDRHRNRPRRGGTHADDLGAAVPGGARYRPCHQHFPGGNADQ